MDEYVKRYLEDRAKLLVAELNKLHSQMEDVGWTLRLYHLTNHINYKIIKGQNKDG